MVVFQSPILSGIHPFSVFILTLAEGLMLGIFLGYLFNGILLVGQPIQLLHHTMSQFSLKPSQASQWGRVDIEMKCVQVAWSRSLLSQRGEYTGHNHQESGISTSLY